MKQVWALIYILLGFLTLWSCDSQPLPSSMSNIANDIQARGIITGTSIPKGEKALFNATGQTPLTDEVFEFNGSHWENAETSIPTGTIDLLTVLYPAYNEEGDFITQNPYADGALQDVLTSQNTITDQTNLQLEFKHLFAKLTLHVESAIQERLTEVSLTAPKVTSIHPINGNLEFEGEHTTYLNKSTTGDYTFMIPYQSNCTLKLTFIMANEEVEKGITYRFESGHQYTCDVTSIDNRSGIKTIDDLIDFSLLINGKSSKRPWSDFGYKEGEDTVYCLLNDIVMTGTEELAPIGNHSQAPFAAIFDGNGHTISGLKISASNSTAGLFGRITPKSIIKNLHLDQCASPSISSSASSGVGLLASSCYGTIINCSVTNSTIIVTNSYPTGGIVGNLHPNGNIINSFVHNTNVTSEGFVGSIAGSMNLANITNCYVASNTIKRTGTYSGGIVGSATNSNITNCYTYNITLSTSKQRGQIIGSAQNCTIEHFFYDKTSPDLINNDINGSNTKTFYKRYDTKSFQYNNTFVYDLLNEWVNVQGENRIYTHWTEDEHLPAIFVK